jgi:hypothetical protein
MSTETAPARRTRHATAVAFVVLLSLTAVTSANASPQSFHSFPQARSYYSPSTSMIAPPMQVAPLVAPLSPHVPSGF